MNRPLPLGWSFRKKLDAIRDALTRHTVEHPEARIKVVPKRTSGPHLGDRWHQPAGQAEMDPSMAGLFSATRCHGCGNKVLLASGELHESRWCGQCYRVELNHRDAGRIPPAA